MLVIKVWCLESNLPEEVFKKLHQKIVSAMVDIKQLKIRDENDLLVLFPKDLMQYGLGKELLVEFGSLRESNDLVNEWSGVVGERLALTVKCMFPEARVFLRYDNRPVVESKDW